VPRRSPRFMARLRACCTVHAPVGCAVTPARCSLRVPCSMNTSTYSRLSSAVSTTRKIAGDDRSRLGSQELPPGRPCSPRRRADARGVQDLPHRGRGDRIPDLRELALDSPMAPGRILPRHLDDQRLNRGPGGRTSWPAPARVVPLAGDEVTVPAQDRGRGDGKDLRPPATVHQPRQRRKPDPVGMVPLQAAIELTAQHLVLVAQHQQLGVLGQVRPDQHRQQAEQAPHPPGRRATAAPRDGPSHATDPAAKPSSQHETEFPSGTGCHLGPRLPLGLRMCRQDRGSPEDVNRRCPAGEQTVPHAWPARHI
jgi:hypothetical protein